MTAGHSTEPKMPQSQSTRILRLVTAFLFLVLAFAAGVEFARLRLPRSTALGPDLRSSSADSTTNEVKQIQLFIEPLDLPHRYRIPLNVFVLNTGDVPVMWDSDFSLFVGWEVDGEDGKVAIQPIRESDKAPVRASEEITKRLVSIAPGSFVRKTIDLGKENKRLGCEWSPVDALHAARSDGWEAFWRYEIPKGVRKIRVRLLYDDWDWLAEDYIKMLGKPIGQSGMPNGQFKSNIVGFEVW
jgi:hypothetical protein